MTTESSPTPGETPDAGEDFDAGEADAGPSDAGEQPACRSHADSVACSGAATCAWLVPGCAEPALREAGCYSKVECADGTGCGEGETCVSIAIDPCAGFACDACALLRPTCMPETDSPCHGAHLGRGGACSGPADQGLAPGCCAPWKCDSADVSCERMPPVCDKGERPTAFNNCWGPCVPAGLCAPVAARPLCDRTGGTWLPQACGHSLCGDGPPCPPNPPPQGGCDCGPVSLFDPFDGCRETDGCSSQYAQPCGPRNLGPKLCAPWLVCAEDEETGVGRCEYNAQYWCDDQNPCQPGRICCYDCDGVTPCRNRCLTPEAGGGCPPSP